MLRREAAADNRSLPERALYSRFFSAHAAAGARADAAAVVALTRHLKEKKQPELCSHALTAAGALSPLGRCAVGAAYANESLEELQRGATNFVSDAYVDAAASARERVSWRHFFVAAGASDGLSFEVSASMFSLQLVRSLYRLTDRRRIRRLRRASRCRARCVRAWLRAPLFWRAC